MPTKGKDEYLKYFKYELDKEIEGIAYLRKYVNIRFDSPITNRIILGLETLYNYNDSEFQASLEKMGLKFEYRLDDDQTNSYHLVIDKVTKRPFLEAVLNIALVDDKPKEMLLAAADGMNFGGADTIYDSVDDEGKAFIDTLIKENLLERKTIRNYYFVEE